MEQVWRRSEIIAWSQLLLNSYEKLLQRQLIERTGNAEDDAKALFFAPFVVVSHGTQANPIFNYGNQTALDLWEITWEKFTRMPSRESVEPAELAAQEEREEMLKKVARKGFIENFRGIRISSTGKRFLIEDVIVWNVIGIDSQHCAQAATYPSWSFINN